MTAMRMAGFAAETSLYRARRQYKSGKQMSNSPRQSIVPAIPACGNCDWILEQCEINGWRPRAVCNACAVGWCYEEPPMPDPFPDPFDPLPRF
jgi:hypothetical protein